MDGVTFETEPYTGGYDGGIFETLEPKEQSLFPDFGTPKLIYFIALLVVILLIVLFVMALNEKGPLTGMIGDIKGRFSGTTAASSS
jgi:hypothetical protein